MQVEVVLIEWSASHPFTRRMDSPLWKRKRVLKDLEGTCFPRVMQGRHQKHTSKGDWIFGIQCNAVDKDQNMVSGISPPVQPYQSCLGFVGLDLLTSEGASQSWSGLLLCSSGYLTWVTEVAITLASG